MESAHDQKGRGQSPGVIDFRAILELQQDGVVVLDQNKMVKYINPAAAKLLDFQTREQTGTIFPFEIDQQVKEIKIEAEAGKPKVIQIRCQDIIWEGEKASLAQLKDISERKREEELLRHAVEAAETRASELEALKFVADQLNQAALLEEAIQSGLDTVLALLDAEAAWVLLPEETGDTRMIAAYSRSSFLKSEKRTLGAAFHCRGLEKAMGGGLKDAELIANADCMREAGLSPNLPTEHYSISLNNNGEPIGTLNLVLEEGKALDLQDAKLLKTISQQFAIAIQRSMPHSAGIETPKYGKALSKVSQAVNSAMDLPAVLQNVLNLAVELVGAEAGTMGLLTPNRQNLTFLTNFPESASQQTLVTDDNLIWQTVEKGESALLVGKETLQETLPRNFCSDAQSLVLVPIIFGRQTLGVLALYTIGAGKELNAFDLAIAESLGQQAGVAVWNAQLFFEVQQLAITDPLTGLNNQKSFINHAVRELERTWRYKRPLSIISIVIDDIRSINEKFGRENGDRVIQVLGRICSDSLRRVDVLGRYTGNNFIAMLPETKLESAREVAERLRSKVQAYAYEVVEGSVTFTISLGVANLVESEMIDLERFIDRANQALYTAVQMGGNRTLVWEPGNLIR